MTAPIDQHARIANGIISVSRQMFALGEQIQDLNQNWQNLSSANALNAMPTAPLTPTGALDAADGTPNPAHPIDTRTTDGATIERAISANDLAGLLTFLNGIHGAVNGQAVTANGAAPQL